MYTLPKEEKKTKSIKTCVMANETIGIRFMHVRVIYCNNDKKGCFCVK